MLIKKIKVFVLILVLGSLILPLFSQAAGLVPCGRIEDDISTTRNETDPCQICHLFVIFDNVTDFLLFDFIPYIVVLMAVIGGIMYLTANGNPEKVTSANRFLTSIVIGFLIVYGAYVIVNSFFLTIGVATSDFGSGIKNWFTYPCP